MNKREASAQAILSAAHHIAAEAKPFQPRRLGSTIDRTPGKRRRKSLSIIRVALASAFTASQVAAIASQREPPAGGVTLSLKT